MIIMTLAIKFVQIRMFINLNIHTYKNRERERKLSLRNIPTFRTENITFKLD